LSEDNLSISGRVMSLADPAAPLPIAGATVQAWNGGNWFETETVSGADGAFTLSGLGMGAPYQFFAWLDSTFIDLATTIFHFQADHSGLMLELMPKEMWNEKLGAYDTNSAYLLGTIWGGPDSPLEGAVVLVYDSMEAPLAENSFTIRYFDRDLDLDPGLAATSANGMFLITLTNAALDESNTDPGTADYPHARFKDLKITASKEGWTFPPLHVSPRARVFPFYDSARSGIVTVAEVSGSENPVIPEEDDKDKDKDEGDDGGGGGGCFISTARW